MPEIDIGARTNWPAFDAWALVYREDSVTYGTTFADIHDGAGTNTNHGGGTQAAGFVSIFAGTFYVLWRSIFTFDTSVIGPDFTIRAATVKLYGSGESDVLSISPTIDIFGATPASKDLIVAADYQQCGTTSFTGAPKGLGDWDTAGFNAFALNATGLAAIVKGGITALSIREATKDAPNVSFVSSSTGFSGFGFKTPYGLLAPETVLQPRLVITYEMPARVIIHRA